MEYNTKYIMQELLEAWWLMECFPQLDQSAFEMHFPCLWYLSLLFFFMNKIPLEP